MPCAKAGLLSEPTVQAESRMEAHRTPPYLLLHIELLEEGRPADLHLDTYVGEPMLGGVKLGPCAINLSDDGLTEGLGRSRGKARFKW